MQGTVHNRTDLQCALPTRAHVAFYRNFPAKGSGLEADHIDGSCENDCVYNLRLVP